jgi:hypothetical protein
MEQNPSLVPKLKINPTLFSQTKSPSPSLRKNTEQTVLRMSLCLMVDKKVEVLSQDPGLGQD